MITATKPNTAEYILIDVDQLFAGMYDASSSRLSKYNQARLTDSEAIAGNSVFEAIGSDFRWVRVKG